jgi:hypothetical protein
MNISPPLDRIEINDESGDKKYFTILPNYIANHSSANDQALYFQMKRIAGEGGECYASESFLCKKLEIGRIALKQSIKYLLDHKWIKHSGKKLVNTAGGPQLIKVYTVLDIWELNNTFYKGVSKTAPLSETAVLEATKGVSETTQRGVQNDIKGVSETAPKKNIREEEQREEDKTLNLSLRRDRGNPSPIVDSLIDYLTGKVKLLDGSAQDNRRYAWIIYSKLAKSEGDGDHVINLIQKIIDAAMADKFHSGNCTSFRYLYYNMAKIVRTSQIKQPNFIKV